MMTKRTILILSITMIVMLANSEVKDIISADFNQVFG